jgi:hypothetical protein
MIPLGDQDLIGVEPDRLALGAVVSCTPGRQLFDDFGVDTDSLGFAQIACSHDGPNLGGSGTYTGYAEQTGGTTVGSPNN